MLEYRKLKDKHVSSSPSILGKKASKMEKEKRFTEHIKYETMKIYSLDSIKTPHDLMCIAENIKTSQPCVIVLDTLTDIADKVQEISISLFHIEIEYALKKVQLLTDYCMDWINRTIASERLKKEAANDIKIRIGRITELCNEAPYMIDDHELMAQGSIISTLFLSYFLRMRGTENCILNSFYFLRLGIDRKPDMENSRKNLEEYIKDSPDMPVYITQNELCMNVYNETCLLPHGGKDYYATLIGDLFHADEIVLCTPDNVMADSIKMQQTYSITYSEAENLIDCGGKFVSAECISLARSARMTIELVKIPFAGKNHLRISAEGAGAGVKAIVSRQQVVFIKLKSLEVLKAYLFIGKVFDTFEKYKVLIHAVVTSNVNISMAVSCSNDTLRFIYRELGKYAEVGIETDMAVVSVVGNLSWEHTGMEARIINTLCHIPVYLISYGSSNHNVSVVVREKDRVRALEELEGAFGGV